MLLEAAKFLVFAAVIVALWLILDREEDPRGYEDEHGSYRYFE